VRWSSVEPIILSEAEARFDPVERIAGRLDSGVLFLCDHASNALPAPYATLGLGADVLEQHIAYDIGAAFITRRLAELFEAPALLTRFSRLLIDANRGADDPTLVMRLSDGKIVPGNARVTAEEIARRQELFRRPYREAIGATIEAMTATGPLPAVVSLHSFTPVWRSRSRPWEVGILWDRDPRFALPLMAALAENGLAVGDNEPYDGALVGDTLDEEITRRGLAGLLIETRQDLVATEVDARSWADRLAGCLRPVLAGPEVHAVEYLPSRTGRHVYESWG